MHAIYKIRNLINGKIYVGSALDYDKRKRSHKNDLLSGRHTNAHLQRSWDKNGKNSFVFEIIEKVIDKDKLIEREQRYLKNLNPEYNMCKIAGSVLGYKHTEETKNRFFRKPLSKETREAMEEECEYYIDIGNREYWVEALYEFSMAE